MASVAIAVSGACKIRSSVIKAWSMNEYNFHRGAIPGYESVEEHDNLLGTLSKVADTAIIMAT